MRQNKKYCRADVLYNAMLPKVLQKIDEHNRQYPNTALASTTSESNPTVIYKKSYPARVKGPQKTTAVKLVKQASQHFSRQINQGRAVITNAFPTNRMKARGKECSKRQAPIHIAKGVLCGIFLGREATATDGNDYKFVQSPEGEIIGAYPHKKNHGHTRDFELLLNPDILPLEILKHYGVTVAAQPDFDTPPRELYMQRKTPNSSVKLETLNKEISYKASTPEVVEIFTEVGNLFEVGNQDKVGNENSVPQKNSGDSDKKTPELPPFHRIYLGEGSPILAFAKFLIESYISKLADAMGRNYHSNEIRRGINQAVRHLSTIPPTLLDQEVNRLTNIIDHMYQWMIYYKSIGQRKTIPGPNLWFDPDYKKGIYGAYESHVKPWEEKRKSWGKPNQVTTQRSQKEEERISKQSEFLNLAFRFKKAYSFIHSGDNRVKRADIVKWSKVFELMVSRDKKSLSEVTKVAEWMFKSGSDRANFWLRESGGFGIRSATGFRRNYAAIHGQMIQEKLTMSGRNENPGKNRKK